MNAATPESGKVALYREEEISFYNSADGIELAGTLTIPRENAGGRVVILIAGYGPYDRNATNMGHHYFRVLADYLAKQSIAVLRFDKRGTGSSTGSWMTATSEDLARDVREGVAYLTSRKDLGCDSIGLIGLSEGGLIAAMVAAQSRDVAYAVLMAPALAMSIDDLLYHTALQLRADGASEEFITRDRVVRQEVYEIARQQLPDTIAQEEMRRTIDAYLQALPEYLKQESVKLPFALTEAKLDKLVGVLTSPAYRFFLRYDPAGVLRKVTIPALVMIGDHDYIASAIRVFPIIEAVSQQTGRYNFTMVELPHLNHMFQRCVTGSLMEYGTIAETMAPVALKCISDWINGLK